VRELGRVRPPATLLHVGELVAQGGDAALGELDRDRRHERMLHAGAGAMRQHIAGARARRCDEQAGDAARVIDLHSDGLGIGGHGTAPVEACIGAANSLYDGDGKAGRPPAGCVREERSMCRNIRTLFNFEPPATEDEIRASALQFVRKLSGFTVPSKANEAAFNLAVDEVSGVARRLITSLATVAPPRNREVEAEKARARARERYG
jgi:hypothetical protein